jgi:hypothetical protein
MSSTFLGIVQMLPPFIVIGVLVFASVAFYNKYVLKAQKLAETLRWIKETVDTIRADENSGAKARKLGLNKVFQDTILEEHWVEFARTLHEQKEFIQGDLVFTKHRVTVPAHHYFTAAAIIDKPLKVNYFKHLPGILTGVGIIGTFAGLLFGLSSFDASSPATINASVGLLLSGVRDAFYASAFAITAAMVVTHLEKLHYQRCLTHLEDLNESINRMFDSGVTDDYLGAIARSVLLQAEQTKALGVEIANALRPAIAAIEHAQTDAARVCADAVAHALNSANLRLAGQIESALERQVRSPLELLNSRFSRTVLAGSPDQSNERLKKIIRTHQASVVSTDEKAKVDQ